MLWVLCIPGTGSGSTLETHIDRSGKGKTVSIPVTVVQTIADVVYLPVTGPSTLRFGDNDGQFDRKNILSLNTLQAEIQTIHDALIDKAHSVPATSPAEVAATLAAATTPVQSPSSPTETGHAEENLAPEPWQGEAPDQPRRRVQSTLPPIDLSRDYVGNFQYFDPEDVLPFFKVEEGKKPKAVIGVPFELPTQSPMMINPSRATYSQSE